MAAIAGEPETSTAKVAYQLKALTWMRYPAAARQAPFPASFSVGAGSTSRLISSESRRPRPRRRPSASTNPSYPDGSLTETPPAVPRAGSRLAEVIDLLSRDQGATIGELIAATNWLPHTTRAALAGLRVRLKSR
jgi:Protein of unknown function (DUF3489)